MYFVVHAREKEGRELESRKLVQKHFIWAIQMTKLAIVDLQEGVCWKKALLS
jgi:hypothetical protein